MQQTFLVNPEPRILIENVSGDLSITPWDTGSINLTTGNVSEIHQEGNTIIIRDCEDDLILQVPYDTEIHANNVEGDVAIKQVRRVELRDVEGDVLLERIGQGVDIEAITVSDISGDLVVRDATTLRAREVTGRSRTYSRIASSSRHEESTCSRASRRAPPDDPAAIASRIARCCSSFRA